MISRKQNNMISCLLVVLLSALSVMADEGKGAAWKSYEAVREGLRRNKQEMCAFLLSDIDNQNEVLDLEKVTFLFESALDHLAKTSDYVTLMRPHVEQKVIRTFDEQGGNFVLEISRTRLQVIEEYKRASEAGASNQEKQEILEKYFYKACDFKLSTVVAEKAMYESALKAEKSLQVKLFPEQ